MIYVVTDNRDSILEKWVKSLEELLGSSSVYSTAVKKPEEPQFTELWEERILQRDLNNVECSKFVLLDGSSKDLIGICVIAGFCIARQVPFQIVRNDLLRDWSTASYERHTPLQVLQLIDICQGENPITVDLQVLDDYIRLAALALSKRLVRAIAVRSQLVVRRLVQEYEFVASNESCSK